jgi:hypothetical protein
MSWDGWGEKISRTRQRGTTINYYREVTFLKESYVEIVKQVLIDRDITHSLIYQGDLTYRIFLHDPTHVIYVDDLISDEYPHYINTNRTCGPTLDEAIQALVADGIDVDVDMHGGNTDYTTLRFKTEQEALLAKLTWG